jgi:hypothetical protein
MIVAVIIIIVCIGAAIVFESTALGGSIATLITPTAASVGLTSSSSGV